MDVSIIIVNYNTKDLTRDCLRTVYEQTKDVDFEVIVSDNGSKDGSTEMIREEFPEVILVENRANIGFGPANNRALEVAKGKYVFYLNSDTLLRNNAVKIFFDYWESHQNESIGVLGASMIDLEGKPICSKVTFPEIRHSISDTFKVTLRIYKKWIEHVLFKYQFKPVTKEFQKVSGDVDIIVGADMFMKNDGNAVFDEHYFMYEEEFDLQYRCSLNKLRRIIIDGPEIVHLEGASQKKVRYELIDFGSFSQIYSRKNEIYYFKKFRIASPLQIFILKFLLLALWMNPLIFKNTRKYIGQMLAE